MLFGGWIVVASLLFLQPISALIHLSLSNDNASHLILVPFISAWILFVERKKIFQDLSYGKVLGGCFLFLACCAALASRLAGGGSLIGVQISGYVFALGLFWIAGFVLLFGTSASRAGSF